MCITCSSTCLACPVAFVKPGDAHMSSSTTDSKLNEICARAMRPMNM